MKYKLLKPLPLAKAWTEVEYFKDTKQITLNRVPIAYIHEEQINEWLEEIKEPKTIYDLKEGDEYWNITEGYISEHKVIQWDFKSNAHIENFCTEREAKRNKLLRELATRTDKWLPNEWEYYSTWLWWKQPWGPDMWEIMAYHVWLIFRNKEEYNKYMTEEAKDLLFKL